MNNGESFTFVIKEKMEILATYSTGWRKELNIVEWNGNNGKFDIRDWSPAHDSMSRGVTLHEAEARKLADALNKYFAKQEK